MQVRVVDRNITVRAPAPAGGGLETGAAIAPKGASFAEILGQTERTLSFSKHAEERLQSSGQVMDSSKMAQLENAVVAAMSKGARSTLVLMKGLAFVVAPQSRTVITVIPEERMKENVFTSIDSAVVVDR
jgi:flagellar operon protein